MNPQDPTTPPGPYNPEPAPPNVPQQPAPSYTPEPQPYGQAQPHLAEVPPVPAPQPGSTNQPAAEQLPPPEPAPDVPSPTLQNEEIVDPSLAQGNHEILIIKRHPFGLIALYLQAVVGLGVALGLVFFLVPSLLSGDTEAQAMHYLSIFAVVAIAFVAIVLMVATYIYRKSRWIVTDDSIHQTLQRGLFSHQSSELSMANIEDVTADQKGILAEMFGFGTLKAETAGELPYFHFNYCPTPDKYAKIILDARERFINEDPAEAKRANDLLNVPGARR